MYIGPVKLTLCFMKFQFILLGLFCFLIISCKPAEKAKYLEYYQFDTLQFNQTTSIRGIDVLNDSVVWLSGNNGFFARTVSGGKEWNSGIVASDELLDFRDIHAFSDNEAIAMSAGSPGRIYKTINGGKSWDLKYQNNHPSIFFNSLEFWDNKRGLVCGDPIDGIFQILITNDGGESWTTVQENALPKSLENEGGFAASGTSIALRKDGLAIYGLGGDSTRILRSEDFGQTWKAINTPFISGMGGYGIYSIDRVDDSLFIATGGHWQYNEQSENNFIISTDSGENWGLAKSMPNGFRSCIRYGHSSGMIIVSGRNGVDISSDIGETWLKTDLPPYYTFDLSDTENLIVFAGAIGKVAIKNRNYDKQYIE